LTGEFDDTTTSVYGSITITINSEGTITSGEYSPDTMTELEPITGNLQSSGIFILNIQGVGTWTGALTGPVDATITATGTNTSNDNIFFGFMVNPPDGTFTDASGTLGNDFCGTVTQSGNSSTSIIVMGTGASGSLSGYQLVNVNGTFQFAAISGSATPDSSIADQLDLTYQLTGNSIDQTWSGSLDAEGGTGSLFGTVSSGSLGNSTLTLSEQGEPPL
jgi:hypothetical protein